MNFDNKKAFTLFITFLTIYLSIQLAISHEVGGTTLITGNQIVIDGKTILAGITPDNFLYGLDVALDKLSLLLTFDPEAKAKKGLEIARERLLEAKEMISQNKLDSALKAQEEHKAMIREVEAIIPSIRKDNSTEELVKTVEIEKEIEEHEDEIDSIIGQAVIKIKILGNLTESQVQSLNNLILGLKNLTQDVKVKLDEKKLEIKARIKSQLNISESDAEKEIKKIENATGVLIIKQEKALERILEANETLEDLRKEIDQIKSENKTIPEAVLVLYNQSIEKLNSAIEAYNSEKYGEAFGQAVASESISTNTARLLERIEGAEVKEVGKHKVEVEYEEGVTKVKVEINGTEAKFILPTTNKEEIISQVSEAIGIPSEELRKLVEEGKIGGAPLPPVKISPISPVPPTKESETIASPGVLSKINQTPLTTQKQTKSVVIEADDYGFYISNQKIENLLVSPNQEIEITFRVRESNVYYGGLDFRSTLFNTGKVEPGKETKVKFSTTQPFTITSYWPLSNVMKANLNVQISSPQSPLASSEGWYAIN